MVVKVFVTCCGADKAVAVVEEAIKLSGVQARVEVVDDILELAKAGIIYTPAIKVGDRLVASGKIPKVQDLVTWLSDASG